MRKGEPSINDDVLYEEYRESIPMPEVGEVFDPRKLQAWLHADDLAEKRRAMIKAKRRKK